ncbi:1-aminocyclopropane-1-carboxylate deaminase [Formosa agariphila KMM 3901]|uniref:1-aminocyclopropane-1-carboxylate deaminase n=1 Tax=Formosa agariphila (strain DSM 15362 / KCTC 12365 / LMG 23005 / KMM 3901 / M-2Alg 35-1) TaxID=1347342 RepID=T2KNT5_FORAG|nr:pyridoxal-phosphate dependent enzyme [Formosa agariphila]CDF80532.1 1-aminocyclopropane-1-carboxylate deaminase [Formosa agariphila KMM 3901]
MLFSTLPKQIPNVPIPIASKTGIQLSIKREDEIHPFVSGNKYRKLQYNVLEAQDLAHDTLLTFGGAYSNHIAAVAYAGKVSGFKTIGIVRGEELALETQLNPTLQFATDCGMDIKYVTRSDYRRKEDNDFIEHLQHAFGNFYLIPEGGTNALAVKGCEHILTSDDSEFDYICCAVGTGGTISGLINSSEPHQTVLGFPALKGDFLQNNISKFVTKLNWELITDYHFGGYAKINPDLVSFINTFKSKYTIPLDPVYTGKVVYGVMDLIEKQYFPDGSKILVIHTGGLQGVAGMNLQLEKKKMPIII